MRKRCQNPRCPAYAAYGGRGITVCQEWSDFSNFEQWAAENGYDNDKQIDRIDNDGPYSPSNCRFVDRTTNANNKRNNITLTAFGESKTIAEWRRDGRCTISLKALYARVAAGWEPELAITAAEYRRRSAPQH